MKLLDCSIISYANLNKAVVTFRLHHQEVRDSKSNRQHVRFPINTPSSNRGHLPNSLYCYLININIKHVSICAALPLQVMAHCFVWYQPLPLHLSHHYSKQPSAERSTTGVGNYFGSKATFRRPCLVEG